MRYDSGSLFRLTVAQYLRLLELGILGAGSQIELLEGLLIEGLPRNTAVALTFEKVTRQQLPDGWRLACSSTVSLCESKPESAPKPACAIVRAPFVSDGKQLPRAADIGVVVEIASSCSGLEQAELGRIYARAGVPIYWVCDFAARIVEVFTQPSGPIDSPHYAKRDKYPVGASVPIVLDGNTVGSIAVSDVMG